MTASEVRWTPARIRKATAYPKPEGAIRKLRDEQAGRFGPLPDLSPLERMVLRHIANELDILDVVTPTDDGRDMDQWMVVRAPAWLLGCLAEFEADREDLEDGHDTEPEETDNDIETEPDDDTEPSVVRPTTMDRAGLTNDEAHPTLLEHQAKHHLRVGGSASVRVERYRQAASKWPVFATAE